MFNRLRAKVGGLRRRTETPGPGTETPGPATSPATAADLAELRRRVAELEAEVQENRRLNTRIAELTDIVEELLMPMARHDDALVEETLRRHAGKFNPAARQARQQDRTPGAPES